MTQEDIDKEDDQLITTLIDKFSGGAAQTSFNNRNNNEVRLGTSPPIAKRGELMGGLAEGLKKSP